MDLRCFSRHVVPLPFRHGADFIAVTDPDIFALEEKSKACMLKLFNISSIAEFKRIVFGYDPGVPLSFSVGSIFLNLINPEHHSLLHHDNLEGMRRYFAIVRQAYDNDNLNFDAFQRCYDRNKILFEANIDPDTPSLWDDVWAIAMQVMFGLRLTFSDAAVAGIMVAALALLVAKIAACRALCRWCRRRWGGRRRREKKKKVKKA